MSRVRIRLLGAIEVVSDSGVAEPGPRARRLLAALALRVGECVSLDRLAFALWEDDPPENSRGAIHAVVARMRKLLGEDAIVQQGHGYVMRADPDDIDVARFERLIREALELVGVDSEAVLERCLAAFSLWHGDPFGDIGDAEFLVIDTQRLHELRLAALEAFYETALSLGQHSRVIPSMVGSVLDQPYREKLWYLLITGLARNGRRVEALRACRQVSEILSELGLIPSAALRELEQRILEESREVEADLGSHSGWPDAPLGEPGVPAA